jgi:hypothetical protein
MSSVGKNALIRPSDLLFVFDEPQAYHPKNAAPKWVEIAAAYKSAADQLLGQVKAQKRIVSAALYPVVFLYRHFIEMEIKSILLLSYIGMEEGEARRKISAVLRTHDPKRLADELANSPTLDEALRCQIHYLDDDFMGRQQSAEILDSFLSILDEVSAVDPGSYTFRYSVTKDFSPTGANLHGLSLSKLEAVAGRFEATCLWLRGILERHIDNTVDRDLSDSEMFGDSR